MSGRWAGEHPTPIGWGRTARGRSKTHSTEASGSDHRVEPANREQVSIARLGKHPVSRRRCSPI